MKIEHHISQLLYRYQCVTVPGFGAFLTEMQPARLLESNSAFYPPRKIISFNGNLKNNDGLLATHISQNEKVTYEIAVQDINNAVELWKNELQNNQPLALKNIGQFSLNTEGNLRFEPSESINYFTGSFGLNSFVSPAITREIFAQTETVEEEIPVLQLEPEKPSRPYLKYAAIFVLGLGTAGFFANNFYNNYQDNIAAENLMVQKEVQKKVQDKIQEATFFIETPLPAVTLSVKEQKLNYHIVAGAFRNENNAQKIFEKLSAKGFKARRIDKNRHGLHPVLYGSFTTLAEAQTEMKKIQKTENAEAWLLIQEL